VNDGRRGEPSRRTNRTGFLKRGCRIKGARSKKKGKKKGEWHDVWSAKRGKLISLPWPKVDDPSGKAVKRKSRERTPKKNQKDWKRRREEDGRKLQTAFWLGVFNAQTDSQGNRTILIQRGYLGGEKCGRKTNFVKRRRGGKKFMSA